MDWKSRRVEAMLEQALVEDRVTNDVTTAMTVEPGLRASGTVLARQDCVICGLGCIPRFLEIFGRLEKKTTSRFEVMPPWECPTSQKALMFSLPIWSTTKLTMFCRYSSSAADQVLVGEFGVAITRRYRSA